MAFGVIITVGYKQGSVASCPVKLSGLIKFAVLAWEGGLEHQVLVTLPALSRTWALGNPMSITKKARW